MKHSPYDHGVSAAFTADDQAAISHRNAQALFLRLAPSPAPPPRSTRQLT